MKELINFPLMAANVHIKGSNSEREEDAFMLMMNCNFFQLKISHVLNFQIKMKI